MVSSGPEPLDVRRHGSGPEKLAGHVHAVVGRQGREREPDVECLIAEGRSVAGTIGHDEQHALRGDALGQARRPFFRGGVHPVRVLEHHDVRLSLGRSRQHLVRGVDDLRPAQLGVHGADRSIAGIDSQHRSQERQGRDQALVQPPHALLELGGNGLYGIAFLDRAGLSQHVHDRVKRHRPSERDRLRLDPRRCVAEPLPELLQEP